MNKHFLAVLAILALALGACQPIVEEAAASDRSSQMAETEVIQFDVAEDMNRFIFDQDVVYDDGMPADGSSFITRGYLYEYGTLTDGSGVNPDGSPEFPDKVIGEWICQGTMINDAAHATSGVWVFSTQFFQIGDEPGAQTITSTFEGRDAVFAGVFETIGAEWENFAASVDEYIDAGNRVITLGVDSGTYKATAKLMFAPAASIWTLEEGKIVKFVQYIDTHAVIEATQE